MFDSSYLILCHFEYIKKKKENNKKEITRLNIDSHDIYPLNTNKSMVFVNPLIKKSSPLSSVESDAETVVVNPSDETKGYLRYQKTQR